jgi:hypothetical protein
MHNSSLARVPLLIQQLSQELIHRAKPLEIIAPRIDLKPLAHQSPMHAFLSTSVRSLESAFTTHAKEVVDSDGAGCWDASYLLGNFSKYGA